MPPAAAPLLTQRPILSPIGQLLPEEGALRYVLASYVTSAALRSARSLLPLEEGGAAGDGG